MRRFVAQLATTSNDKFVKVWGWALREIGDDGYNAQGNSLIDFMESMSTGVSNYRVYIHNLRYYGQFIIWWLMDAGFTFYVDEENRESLSFTTLAGSDGSLFKIEVYFDYNDTGKKKKMNSVIFYDSKKVIDASIEEINRDFHFGLDIKDVPEKEDCDDSYIPTEEEYKILNDRCEVIVKAMSRAITMGLSGMTIGSCALNNFKKQYYHREFVEYFPILNRERDDEIRKAYRGGYCYLNPIYRNKELEHGITIDKNSMYPSKMVGNYLPFGEPEYFEGQYKYDKFMPLYIQTIQCRFDIKPGKMPCVQVRSAWNFNPTIWQESSLGELVVITMTSVDLELFKENYNIRDIKYLDGWKFQAAKGIFTRYVRKWANLKAKSKLEGNHSEFEISKKLLNSLYGKLATNTRIYNSYPVYNRDKQVVDYKLSEPKYIDPVYTAAGAFITALARADIIRTAQAIRDYSLRKYGVDKYVYTDTDCIKTLLNREDLQELSDAGIIKLHETTIGRYKIEDEFVKAKFIKPKCYIQIYANGSKKVCVAGLPKTVGNSQLDWDTFKTGWNTRGLTEEEKKAIGCKTTYRLVPGGCTIETEDFEILP